MKQAICKTIYETCVYNIIYNFDTDGGYAYILDKTVFFVAHIFMENDR